MNDPLNIQIIKSISGKPEFVLIPVAVYNALRETIEDELARFEAAAEKVGYYVPFVLENYVDNPVALARIKANVTQRVLAKRLGASSKSTSARSNTSIRSRPNNWRKLR